MTLAHDLSGAGPTAVLLHSAVCDRRMWDPQAHPLINAGYQMLRCDFRGFGETPASDRPHNDAQDVLDLMDTLAIERAALVGSSFGGRVAVEIAARWPDRVTNVMLLCPSLRGNQRSPELKAFGEREDQLLEAGDIAGAVELNLDTWLGPDADGEVRERVRRMQRHAFEVQLAAEEVPRIAVEFDLADVRAPCLAVTGAHDLPDFRTIPAGLRARHVELPWAGHLPSVERPAAVTSLLIDFLRETGAEARITLSE